MGTTFVYCEHKDGKFRRGSLEAVSAAKGLGGEVVAIAVGPGVEEAAAADLGKYGATKAILVQDGAVENYSPEAHAAACAKLAQDHSPAAFLFSASSQGKDVAPRVAALLEAGLASDCTEIQADGENLKARRPIYAGKAYALVESSGQPFMATLRPNVFPASEGGSAATVEKVASGIDAGASCSAVKEFKKSEGEVQDVAEAGIVVSGGRGLGEAKNWNLVEDLARALGGASGASRAVVDAGWRPHSEQVGQTGKTVAPVLYVALGISGAIQHLAGMRTSKYIVAVNKDSEAPIFKVANYGIVGDVFEVAPALTKAIEEIKAKDH